MSADNGNQDSKLIERRPFGGNQINLLAKEFPFAGGSPDDGEPGPLEQGADGVLEGAAFAGGAHWTFSLVDVSP